MEPSLTKSGAEMIQVIAQLLMGPAQAEDVRASRDGLPKDAYVLVSINGYL